MKSLKNHTVIVVGASRGVGRAIAVELASQGAIIGLFARHKAQLQETAELCNARGGEAFIFLVDVTDEVAVALTVQKFIDQQKKLDVVILCQGILYRSFLVDDPTDQWRRVLSTNLLASIHLTRLTLPYLIQQPPQKHQRAIIYISSIAGKQFSAGISAYCASKAGLIGFAHSIFEEVREHGVKVSVICPGYINTTMVSAEPNLAPEKMIQPDTLAQMTSDIIHAPMDICPVEIILKPQFSPVVKR